MTKAGDLEGAHLRVSCFHHHHHHNDLRVVRELPEIHPASGSHSQPLGVGHAAIRGNSVKTTILRLFYHCQIGGTSYLT